jgi:hypothetical protein
LSETVGTAVKHKEWLRRIEERTVTTLERYVGVLEPTAVRELQKIAAADYTTLGLYDFGPAFGTISGAATEASDNEDAWVDAIVALHRWTWEENRKLTDGRYPVQKPRMPLEFSSFEFRTKRTDGVQVAEEKAGGTSRYALSASLRRAPQRYVISANLTRIHRMAITDITSAITAGFAVYGLGTWRAQTAGKRKLELAEEALILFYEARDAVKAIRSPFAARSLLSMKRQTLRALPMNWTTSLKHANAFLWLPRDSKGIPNCSAKSTRRDVNSPQCSATTPPRHSIHFIASSTRC